MPNKTKFPFKLDLWKARYLQIFESGLRPLKIIVRLFITANDLFISKSKICEKYIFTQNLEIRNKMESLIPRLRNRWTFPDKRFPKFCPIELVRDSWWHYKVLTFKLYFLSKLYFSYKNFPRILLTNVIDLKFNWCEFS